MTNANYLFAQFIAHRYQGGVESERHRMTIMGGLL